MSIVEAMLARKFLKLVNVLFAERFLQLAVAILHVRLNLVEVHVHILTATIRVIQLREKRKLMLPVGA